MLRAVLDKRLICVSIFPFNFWSNVNSDLEKPKELTKTRIMFDKIKDTMFDEVGNPTKELQSVINVTVGSTIIGFVLGGMTKAKDVPATYRAENQATLYKHKFDAHREVQTNVTKAIVKGGFPFALKLGTFCFLFASIDTGLFVYRSKFSVLNSMCAGAISGFIYKTSLGLKAAFVGSLLGAILGTIYGTMTQILLLVTKTDMNDLYRSDTLLAERRKLIKKKTGQLILDERAKAMKLREKREKEEEKEREKEKDKESEKEKDKESEKEKEKESEKV